MTACPIRYQRQVPDRKGKIFYTSITSLSHISKGDRVHDKMQMTVRRVRVQGIYDLVPREKMADIVT